MEEPTPYDLHPEAMCPDLTVSDLFLFRDLCEAIIGGLSISGAARKVGEKLNKTIDKNRCHRVLRDVAAHLLQRSNALPHDLKLDTPGSEGESFYRRLCAELGLLSKLNNSSPSRANRVIIHASDFCVLWVLPAVLQRSRSESGFIQSSFDLEIRRGSFRKYMTYLRNGATDLAMGPEANDFKEFERIELLSVPRVLIYPKGHIFACGKAAPDVRLADLQDETIFCLDSAAVPNVKMESYFPFPAKKCVIVDSVSHIYQYVARKLGVSLGYHPAFVPEDFQPEVSTLPLRGEDADRVKPAKFFLYYSKLRPLSTGAQLFESELRAWSTQKMNLIAV